MNSIVSVIIPTYNTNNSLKKAINSVLEQTYIYIEVIVVDDNIPNSEGRYNCENIMKQYKGDKRVKYIQHKENKNGSAARNTGVLNSVGKYVSFLDDDDYFYNFKIEKQLNYMINNNYDFCTCYYDINKKIYKFKVKDDYILDILFANKVPQTSSFVMSKKLFINLNGFNESYQRHQDYEFLLRACLKTKIGVIAESLYTRTNNNVNNTPNGEKLELIKNKFLDEFEYVINQYKINKSKLNGRNYSLVFIAYLKNKDLKNAYKILKIYKNFYFVYFTILQLGKMFTFKSSIILKKILIFKDNNIEK